MGVFFDSLGSFLHKYFIEPGYDWVDTPTYGLILGFLVIFAVIPVLKRLEVKIDGRFLLGIAPFIVYGATARELVDRGLGFYGLAGNYPGNFYLVSPWIFFTMFFLTVICMAFGMLVSRNRYHIPMLAAGSVLAAYNLFLILSNMREIAPVFYVAVVFTFFMLLIYFLSKTKVFSFLGSEFNLPVVGAHLLDASATYVGISYLGFGEQHVLPNLFIDYFGTAFIMFPLKLIVLFPALYVTDKELGKDETARRFIKLVILILGVGPALRDVVMMLL